MLKVEGNKRIERVCKGMREQSMRVTETKTETDMQRYWQSKRVLTFSSSLSVQGLNYMKHPLSFLSYTDLFSITCS